MIVIDFAEKFMALGIITVVGYLVFLLWANLSAPTGENSPPLINSNFIDLGISLTLGYSIHDFVVQVLVRTTTADKFKRVVTIVYFSSIICYTIYSLSGMSLINREPRVDDPETIEEYFPKNSWQVQLIQIIFFLHLITVSPEFCTVIKYSFKLS